MKDKPATHYPALDGLRGLSILLVLMSHQTLIPSTDPVKRWWFDFWATGWIGADFFLVLSGFLITRVLLREKGSAYYFRNFYARRFWRIVPLYYVALLLLFCVYPRSSFAETSAVRSLLESPWVYFGFFTNFLFAWDPLTARPPVSPYWSLALEEQFYLLWPFVVAACSRRVLVRGLMAFVVICTVARVAMHLRGVSVTALYVLPVPRADTLALGALVALWAEQDQTHPRVLSMPSKLFFFAVGMVGCVTSMVLGRTSFLLSAVGYSCVAVFGAFLVWECLAGSASLVARVLQQRWLCRLGLYSYGLFLLHYPVLHFCQKYILERPGVSETFDGDWERQFLLYVLATGGAIAVSALAFRYIESPLRDYGRRWLRSDSSASKGRDDSAKRAVG